LIKFDSNRLLEYLEVFVVVREYFAMISLRETLINCLHKRFAALGGAQKLAYQIDMSRFLRFIRLASHLAQAN
jgi:hypothetical protein